MDQIIEKGIKILLHNKKRHQKSKFREHKKILLQQTVTKTVDAGIIRVSLSKNGRPANMPQQLSKALATHVASL